MEFEIYQVVILLTTLFSGSDARPAASRQTAIIRLKQSNAEYSHISQVQKPQDYRSSRQRTFRKSLLAVEKILQSSIERKAVIQRLKQTGQLRKEEYLFPSKNDFVSTFEIAQKTKKYRGGLIRRKSAAKFSKLRRGKVRRRRYVVQGTQWNEDTITWNIPTGSESLTLNATDVNNTLSKAFRIWAEVSPLVFRWVDPPAQANIAIEFATGNHGCPNPFDGVGGILAHAYFPGDGGDVHFDDAELWTADTSMTNPSAKNLLPVAVHEIGHSLGLKHSTVPGSIMNPFYSVLNSNVILSDDDVAGIQDIYDVCNTRMTAIDTWLGNGKTYIYNAANYWRFNDNNLESDRDFPRTISSGWRGVPDNVDEVFLWGHNWKTYYFKGDLYYKYDDYLDEVDPSYPQLISQGWPGIPDGIDAAFSWSNEISFFFKGDQVYKFNQTLGISDPPRNISDTWPGIPANIDSVFWYQYDLMTYFFKDENYWEWDHTNDIAIGPYITSSKWKNICNV